MKYWEQKQKIFLWQKKNSKKIQNSNHVYKDEKYLLSVIIPLGKNISVGDTVFIMELEYITWEFDIIYWTIYMEDIYLVHL